MITMNISLGSKGGRCIGLTTLPPSCAERFEIWEPLPPGTLRACPGLSWDCFTFTIKANTKGKVELHKILTSGPDGGE